MLNSVIIGLHAYAFLVLTKGNLVMFMKMEAIVVYKYYFCNPSEWLMSLFCLKHIYGYVLLKLSLVSSEVWIMQSFWRHDIGIYLVRYVNLKKIIRLLNVNACWSRNVEVPSAGERVLLNLVVCMY